MFQLTRITTAVALTALLTAHSVDAGVVGNCVNPKTIALTFDDPFQHPQLEDLLADLKKYDIPATFFVVPNGDSTFCDSVKKIAAGGHAIENHSWSHDHCSGWSADRVKDEIQKVENAVKQCGITQKLTEFRPPYLESSSAITSTCDALGYDIVTCVVNSDDYDNISLDQCWNNVKSGLQQTNGQGVILHHNWCYRSGGTKGIIQRYAETYKNNGYKFVTVAECAGKASPVTPAPTTKKPTPKPTKTKKPTPKPTKTKKPTPKPTTKSPAPTTQTPAPTTETPAPTTQTPKPTTIKPACTKKPANTTAPTTA